MLTLSSRLLAFLSAVHRRLRPAVACFLSAAIALALAEGAVTVWRQDAFPYLRLFRADAQFGVRLFPNTCARIRTQSGRVVESCTNADGFRGPVRPQRAAPTVAVIGDSQVFGFGVGDGETTPAQLQARLGPHVAVLNRGVPTWGPLEYVAAIDDVAREGSLEHVVLVLNASNDFFEVNTPNVRRTTAEHGWAKAARQHRATSSDAPAHGLSTLRSLWHRSHLVYLLRRVAHASTTAPAPRARSAELLRRDASRLKARASERKEASVFSPVLRQAVARCEVHGCQLTVVVLPIDVQVDPSAWKKYGGQRRIDLTQTLSLLDDATRAAEVAGAKAIGFHRLPKPEAFAGLFLDDNDHLSPKGHRLLADAIANAMGLSHNGAH